MFAGEGPIFQQFAAEIADDIVLGMHPENTAVPSATDFAVFLRMNPAAASKGHNVLVQMGVLYKKRGSGLVCRSRSSRHSPGPAAGAISKAISAPTSPGGRCSRNHGQRTALDDRRRRGSGMTNAIGTRTASRMFGRSRALDDITFTV